MKKQVAIIDSIGSNLASLKFALDRIKVNFIVTNEVKRIRNSSHIILPGVGAARNAMNKLSQHEIIETITTLSQPTLGICLGMQIFMEYSEEDDTVVLVFLVIVVNYLRTKRITLFLIWVGIQLN